MTSVRPFPYLHKLVPTLAALTLLCAGPASAATPAEDKGLAIAQETEKRDLGFGDTEATATMVLKDAGGNESVRRFRMLTLEQTQDGDRSIAIFDAPADLAGTAVLTWSHALTPDDQWLYLPALKRIKRIASKNKAAAFLGSEFAFEDLSSWEVKKFTYRWLRDETKEGVDCFVVENTPAYEDSGYSRQVEWVDKAIYQPRQIDYYDREGALLKTMVFRGYKQYKGKHWRPSEQLMENHRSGKSTRITWDNWTFASGMAARDFTAEALGRGK